MKVVVIPQDLIREDRVWIEAGEYELIRLTDRGYLINSNGKGYYKRQVAQIPLEEGELSDAEESTI